MDHEPRKAKSTAIYWIFIILLVIGLGLSVMLNIGMGLVFIAGEKSLSRISHTEAVDEAPTFEEEWSYGYGDTKVVRMDLAGYITRESDSGFFEPPRDKVEDLVRAIRAARNDAEVKAIILEVDSPGGGITPTDEIYRELMTFKQSDENRKVVIFIRDLAASGGYYVAMAGDWIIAQPTTIVGSIGVIMQTLNWKVLSDKIGVTDTTIKSGENKDLLNPFRESDTKQIEMLQDMIDRMHERFKTIVSQSRAINGQALETLADGRIFSADQAIEHRLIDQVGYWDDAVAKTAELLDVNAVKVVRYYKKVTFWDLFVGVRTPFPSSLQSLKQPPSFEYLWRP